MHRRRPRTPPRANLRHVEGDRRRLGRALRQHRQPRHDRKPRVEGLHRRPRRQALLRSGRPQVAATVRVHAPPDLLRRRVRPMISTDILTRLSSCQAHRVSHRPCTATPARPPPEYRAAVRAEYRPRGRPPEPPNTSCGRRSAATAGGAAPPQCRPSAEYRLRHGPLRYAPLGLRCRSTGGRLAPPPPSSRSEYLPRGGGGGAVAAVSPLPPATQHKHKCNTQAIHGYPTASARPIRSRLAAKPLAACPPQNARGPPGRVAPLPSSVG